MTEIDIATLLEACYVAARDLEFWPHILAQIAASLGARGSAIVPQDERRATEDVERLRTITPHVAHAFTLSAALADARDTTSSLVAGFERLSFGTIILDAFGRAREINPTAERLLGGYLRLDGNRRLHTLFAHDRIRFERLVAGALPGGKAPDTPCMMLKPFGEGRPLLIEAVPLRFAEITLALVGTRGGGALILLHDLLAPARPEIEELLMQLGLSRAEARLAQLVGRGHSPRAAALVLAIAESTARVHLRSCFAKLGIVRQSELAVMVTRLDSLTGLPTARETA